MGVPPAGLPPSSAAEMARAAASQAEASDAFDAPLRMQVESYETFVGRLPHARDDMEGTSRADVEEELRRLDIDPAVFYRDSSGRGAQRLRMRRYDPDEEPGSGDPQAGGGVVRGGSWADPATSSAAVMASMLGFEDDDAPGAEEAGMQGFPGLNAPEEGDEDFEIRLDSGETRGGRLGHETPEGMSAKLQIDSLTEDGDEDDFFRGEVIAEDAPAAEGDGVEPFSLDPEFNYDAPPTAGLSSRMGEAEAAAHAEPPPTAAPVDKSEIVFEPASRAEAA